MSKVSAVWLPKSVIELRNYNRERFVADLLAGITVGLVALPLSMAFAISSGVLPQSGIYCAIVAGFLISALGGSKTQVGGPTGAFVVVVAGIVAKYGTDGLYMCTLMGGVLLLALGITGLGSAVKFIPRPVVVGFTNGIAVLIASTQIKDFFGLSIAKVPGDFAARIGTLVEHFGTLSASATALGVGSLVAIVLLNLKVKRIPGMVLVLVAASLVAWLAKLPVETIQTRFGGIPSGLPHVSIPRFRPELIPVLLPSAITVAMLGAIESLLSAVVSDRMSKDKHNPNVELVAQGFANVASPLFGGLPATGAIARTATSIRSGATSPLAGIIHSATLLLILLVAAPIVQHVPLAVLAAILLVVSYNMGEWREIGAILKLTKSDISVWLITFLLTVFADLTVAVEAGMILAALVYIRKVTATTTVAEVTPEYIEEGLDHSLQHKQIPAGVAIYRVHGPFLFGSTDKLDLLESAIETLPPVVILRLRNMTAIDATGLAALENLSELLHASGRHLILCGMREQPERLMRQVRFTQHVGKRNIVANFAMALGRAERILQRHQGLHIVGPERAMSPESD
ncbi:MAG TPA: solute carrier family 23 protein [Fimbriimonadaceae bacterium]|nr:solute carrier family 23 protein [Fimbriimonadaceae bacterium]